MKPLLLNLGCGASCHPDWLNLDLVPSHPLAQACDLRQGIPYAENSVDACYSSHVLEHLGTDAGECFLAEQFRVLKPGGIIRVVVPDLESICRNYLKFLDASLAGDHQAEFRYDYSVLEMFDQTTRKQSGGELGKLWGSGAITDLDFVLARHGEEARPHIQAMSTTPATTKIASSSPTSISQWTQVRRRLGYLRRLLQKPSQPSPQERVLSLAEKLLGADGRSAVQEGLFRNSGEIHRMMYDRFSLGRLLTRTGFTNTCVYAYNESKIPDFSEFGLDGNIQQPRKPDSLYMEATKPVFNS